MLDARTLAHLDDAFASLPVNPDAFLRHLGRARMRWEQDARSESEHARSEQGARAEPDARTWALVKMLVCARHARLLAMYPALAHWVSCVDHGPPDGASVNDGE